MNIALILSNEFQVPLERMTSTLGLLEEGNTVPFIARYRKEVTGNLQDETLRQIEIRKGELEKLDERRQTVLNTIEDQGKLDEALKKEIEAAQDMQTLEDLYRPYKPKRRTRATEAEEKGLRPLADLFISDEETMATFESAVCAFEGLEEEEIMQGVSDIVAEEIANDPNVRRVLKSYIKRHGQLIAEAGKEPNPSYAMYEDFSAKLRQVKNHNILAINRGESEGAIRVKIETPEETLISLIRQTIKPREDKKEVFERIAKDSLTRLLYPSLERELRRDLKEVAEADAIDVFATNLKPLLLSPPMGHVVVLGIDPGYRTGCKIAIVDENGKFLDNDVIYPTMGKGNRAKDEAVVENLIKQHAVDVIAIGSGTASYETEQFISNLIQQRALDVAYAIVNEDGTANSHI